MATEICLFLLGAHIQEMFINIVWSWKWCRFEANEEETKSENRM